MLTQMDHLTAKPTSRPIRCGASLLYIVVLLLALGSGSANAADADKVSFRETPAAAHYHNALALIESREYTSSLALLRRIQAYYPGFEQLSSVQTRIAVLQEADNADHVLGHYLSALDKRDAGDIDGAISALDFILQQYKDSSLQDDALYLKAYVQIMDRYDFSAARITIATLQQAFPESSYQDSVEYLDAIALEQLGQTAQARLALEALRDKHTALSLPFGISWPEGNVLSRYWYDRADRRLDIIDQRGASASQMRSKQVDDSGTLRIDVNVDGVDLAYELSPSPLTTQTAWLDGVLQDRLPPAAGVFVGKVVGDDASWVRAVIVDDTISGVAFAFGQIYTMQPGTLIGTLDYYQPRSSRTRSASRPDSVSTEAEVKLDSIQAPPELGAAIKYRAATKASDLRVVPVSIVIDAEFDRYHGGNGLVVSLNQLNVADGIYRQFGLALAVDEVQVFGDSDSNPMLQAPATLENYLNSFRDYRQTHRNLFSSSALTYLFTGKQRTDPTLGLAWIDTLCRTDGYDVGIITPSAIGDVLLTHELGHSLGSQHDSDTSCSTDSTKIMWPHISSRTNVEFSSCSQTSLSGARSKSCLVDAVDMALGAHSAHSGVRFELANLDSTVAMDATLVIEVSEAGLIGLPAGCNAMSPTSAQCAVSALQPGETRDVVVPINDARNHADAVVTAQLSPVGTQDFTPANNVATYSVGEQSSTSEHLILSEAVPLSSDNTTQAIDTPAAAKSGSLSWKALLVLLLFVAGLSQTRRLSHRG